jgi:hypothetical protein
VSHAGAIDICSSARPQRPSYLAQWQPLIADKMFLPWLVKVPGEQDTLRARQLSTVQVGRSRLKSVFRV